MKVLYEGNSTQESMKKFLGHCSASLKKCEAQRTVSSSVLLCNFCHLLVDAQSRGRLHVHGQKGCTVAEEGTSRRGRFGAASKKSGRQVCLIGMTNSCRRIPRHPHTGSFADIERFRGLSCHSNCAGCSLQLVFDDTSDPRRRPE